jgi:hypothetical protein
MRELVSEFRSWCEQGNTPSLSAMPAGAQAQVLNALVQRHSNNTCQVRRFLTPTWDG